MTPSEQLHIHQQEYMHRAEAAYEEALLAFADAELAVADMKADLAQARAEIRDMEDEALVNGGYGERYIDANTKEKREAQLRQALKHWPEYQAKREALATLERELGHLEAEKDRFANLMSLNKRRADAHIANVHRAGVIASLGGVKRSTNRG